MVTATNLSGTNPGNDAGGASYGVPSFARVAGRPYLVGIFSGANASGDVPALTDDSGGTWVRLAGGQMSSGGGEFYRIDVFGHVPATSDAVVNLSIAYTTTQLGVSWAVVELGGMPDDSATNGSNLWPSGNVVYDDTANVLQTSNTTTLPAGAGATIVFAGCPGNVGFNMEAGYTEVVESVRSSPLRSLTVGFLNAADTSVTATVSSGVGSKIGMVAIALVTTLTPLAVTVPAVMHAPTHAPQPQIGSAQTLVLDVLSTPTRAPTPTIGTETTPTTPSGLYKWDGSAWVLVPGFAVVGAP